MSRREQMLAAQIWVDGLTLGQRPRRGPGGPGFRPARKNRGPGAQLRLGRGSRVRPGTC
jgi:hypothetical protein